MTEQTERLKAALEGAADRPPRFNTLGLYTEALAAIEHSGLDSVNGSIIFDLMTVIERMEREDVTASDLLAEKDATIQRVRDLASTYTATSGYRLGYEGYREAVAAILDGPVAS